jgi:hypothetical protein
MRASRIAAAAVLASFALAACSATSATPATSASQPSANQQVCRDYAKQRAWVQANRAMFTIQDAVNVGTWLDTDATESTGHLQKDMTAYAAAYQAALQFGTPPASAASLRQAIANDCQAAGVTV